MRVMQTIGFVIFKYPWLDIDFYLCANLKNDIILLKKFGE